MGAARSSSLGHLKVWARPPPPRERRDLSPSPFLSQAQDPEPTPTCWYPRSWGAKPLGTGRSWKSARGSWWRRCTQAEGR